MEMIRTIFILICCYTICAVPKMVRLVMGHDHLFHDTADETMFHQNRSPYYILSFIPYLLQFALNVIVYALANKQYREAYKSYITHLGRKFGFWEMEATQKNKVFAIHRQRRISGSCTVNAGINFD